jgi:hypothetical protein
VESDHNWLILLLVLDPRMVSRVVGGQDLSGVLELHFHIARESRRKEASAGTLKDR